MGHRNQPNRRLRMCTDFGPDHMVSPYSRGRGISPNVSRERTWSQGGVTELLWTFNTCRSHQIHAGKLDIYFYLCYIAFARHCCPPSLFIVLFILPFTQHPWLLSLCNISRLFTPISCFVSHNYYYQITHSIDEAVILQVPNSQDVINCMLCLTTHRHMQL